MEHKYPKATLLIVDDLPSDRQLIKYALEEIGFAGEVTFEHSGQALVDRYLKSVPSSLPDLILLDLNLTDIKGEELLKLLKEHDATCTIPVVIFSSSQKPEAAERCYSLGAGGYVIKPTDYDQIKTLLSHTLEFWLQTAVKRNRRSEQSGLKT
jgi:CheY-like chemotaxis protein